MIGQKTNFREQDPSFVAGPPSEVRLEHIERVMRLELTTLCLGSRCSAN